MSYEDATRKGCRYKYTSHTEETQYENQTMHTTNRKLQTTNHKPQPRSHKLSCYLAVGWLADILIRFFYGSLSTYTYSIIFYSIIHAIIHSVANSITQSFANSLFTSPPSFSQASSSLPTVSWLTQSEARGNAMCGWMLYVDKLMSRIPSYSGTGTPILTLLSQ
jgi:hypothetical protein